MNVCRPRVAARVESQSGRRGKLHAGRHQAAEGEQFFDPLELAGARPGAEQMAERAFVGRPAAGGVRGWAQPDLGAQRFPGRHLHLEGAQCIGRGAAGNFGAHLDTDFAVDGMRGNGQRARENKRQLADLRAQGSLRRRQAAQVDGYEIAHDWWPLRSVGKTTFLDVPAGGRPGRFTSSR